MSRRPSTLKCLCLYRVECPHALTRIARSMPTKHSLLNETCEHYNSDEWIRAGGTSLFKPTFNAYKFRQLMLCVADRSRADHWYWATKLNRILYFCDFRSFAELGQPIIGATYMRLSEGPVPCELLSQRRAATTDEEAQIERKRVFKFTQHRLVPTGPVGLSAECFSPEEQGIIDDTIDFLCPLTAKEVSDSSHQEPGWISPNTRHPSRTKPQKSSLLRISICGLKRNS